MQHENNRQRLERAFPPMDAAFDHAVRSTLENIVQEDTMQVKRPLRVLAITLALVICLAGTALAVGSGLNLFNFFEDIGSPSPTVQPEAYTLTAHDVASHSFEHTDVAVREAAWDGRVLRILYSVRDRTVDRVFTDEDIWDGNYDLPGARQDGITADWGCDYLYVNGVKLCLTGYMASRAGSEPGEVLVALESDLVERIASEKADITLGDTFEVWLPIIGMGGIMCAEDAIEFMLAGASAVAVGTANFVQPDIAETIAHGMLAYLDRHNAQNISEIVGLALPNGKASMPLYNDAV